jgi:hypothetical protein
MDTHEPTSTGAAPPPLPSGAPASPPPVPQVHCRRCFKVIDATDGFCRYCGQNQSPSEAWYYHPVWILVLSFAVLGPFALPLVWMSSRMTRKIKWILTAVIVIYTLLVFYYFYLLWSLLFHHWMNITRQLEQLRR